jgi:hypothetical protein
LTKDTGNYKNSMTTPDTTHDYIKRIEANNEKLTLRLEALEAENDKLVNECSSMSYHYARGEVKLVSVLLGTQKAGFLTIPLFSHPKHSECIKFIDAHHATYWSAPLVRKKVCAFLNIKRLTVMYQIMFICGAKNKIKGDKNWYYGFSMFNKNREAMYYDPRKKAFNVTFKPA